VRVLALLIAAASAQTVTAQPATPSKAEAYYEFMMARRLESQEDFSGALAALKRALALDPSSAELQSELAGYYARRNDGEAAVRAAQAALEIDPANIEAHRVLGLVYSAWAEAFVPPPGGRSEESLRADAIAHLSRIADTPAMATDPNLQLTLGRLQLRTGNAKDAIPILEKVVSQAPYSAEPYALLAEAYGSAGQIDRAVEALSNAADISPGRYAVPLAELYERRGEWADAAGAYERALERVRTPGRDLRLRWISALLNVPNGAGAAKARDAITKLLQSNPKDTRALYLLSAAQRALGDRAAAEETARKLLALEADSMTGLSALASVRMDQHDYRGVIDLVAPFAKDVATRARDREGEAALLLSQLGFAYQQLGELDQAIQAFAKARELEPRSPAYVGYLIQANVAARRFERASELTREALERHPGDDRLVRLHAAALAGLGRAGEGLKVLESAVATEPESRELVIALADLYSDEKQFESAVRVLEDASSRLGEDETLTLQLGAVFEEAGRVADAERQFRRLLELDPLNATALNYLGYMLADRGQRLDEAQELIERALKIDPGNPSFLDSLGWALFKQGRVKEAEEPLRRAAATLRSNSVVQDHFGDVLAALGRFDEAATAWTQALAGDGDSIDRAGIERKIKDAQERRRR
jgi:tetratricopeptide (TPR) repeat protein